jgi:signal transduction histidine kinase
MATVKKLPFKVSARTARLIGRENIASAKGAIIELVKNGYDADSTISIVYFDNQYSQLHSSISNEYYNLLISKGIDKNYLDAVYHDDNNNYSLKNDCDEDNKTSLLRNLAKLTTLYIIDAGEGMTQSIIQNNWMTIGTNNKETNFFTRSGRVKAGAKGIGRFALDKLGGRCEMITIFNPDYHEKDYDEDNIETSNCGYRWLVNWEDFEGDSKTIENVNADLSGIQNEHLSDYIKNIIPSHFISQINKEKEYKFGTILKISNLRDNWNDFYINQVYSDLEVLVPPKENNEFDIFLFSNSLPERYGEVLGSICDDFDYKIIAKADNNKNISIKIVRNEYDVELIPDDFFSRERMQSSPYTKEFFLKGYWEKNYTFSQLIPGFDDVDDEKTLDDIGLFEFHFYFLKKTYTTEDARRFFYKQITANLRKEWLKKFSGIKLFRDNFRVRPYGEVDDVAFDWLGLGSRKASSPAGISKRDGGYRVTPDNVAGSIKISRLTNVNFEDKSSREGLQENKTFRIFKRLIEGIINIFEVDRAIIAREMVSYDNEKYSETRSRFEAEQIAKRILAQSKLKKIAADSQHQKPLFETQEDIKDKELAIIAELNEKKDEEIEKLKEEQKVLRGLASSGIVLASFSHDLGKLNGATESRVDKLRRAISVKILESDYANVEDRKNPFVMLERMKQHDIKIKNWLNFSLGAARKDKRKKNQLFIKKYFNDFKNDWSTVLEEKAIDLDITKIEDLDLRIYEIDFDSIFHNLLVNSIDAFIYSKEARKREIFLSATTSTKDIVINYYDNGPGLSKDIAYPEMIFEPLFTTRRNSFTGEEEGTGLGMWLIKSITEENDGKVSLLNREVGFGIRLTFPIKYKR